MTGKHQTEQGKVLVNCARYFRCLQGIKIKVPSPGYIARAPHYTSEALFTLADIFSFLAHAKFLEFVSSLLYWRAISR